MNWLTDPFASDLMRLALMGGILAVVTTSVVGTWVVLRGLAFMGDALAHGVVPGIALAFLLDINLVVGAVVAAVVMVGAISLIHRTTSLTEDTAIGLLFVGMLALGVIIMSRTRSFAVDLVGILFGQVLGTSTTDVMVQGIAAVIALLGVFLFYRPLLALSFNEDKAEVLGLHPGVTHLVMMGLITLAVVSSFQTVGSLLVFGLLIAPPATAALVARRVPIMMITAAGVGVIAVFFGLLLSYHLDTSAGASVSALSVTIFFFTLGVTKLRTRFRQNQIA